MCGTNIENSAMHCIGCGEILNEENGINASRIVYTSKSSGKINGKSGISFGVDPLEDQIRELVPDLKTMAIGSHTTFLEQFPVFAGIEVNRWDLYFTIAGICASLMGLSQKVGSGERYDKLTGILQQEISKWNPNAENAMSNCMMHMLNQLGVEVPDDPEEAFKGLSFSLGSWLLASSFGRPLSEVEAKHANIVGGFILTFLDDRASS
jgi:hypothetical protein